MEFTQLEVQQIINACLCLGDLVKYVKGEGFVEKSVTLLKIASEIKKEKGTVDMHDMQQKIMR